METDLIIIGAGPGGYRAAEYAARQGLKVTIIEAAHLGGTCLNEGCIPTKCYTRNAEAMLTLRSADTYGITLPSSDGITPPSSDGITPPSLGEGLGVGLLKVRSRKDEVIATLRSGIETLLSHPNITVVRGEARFVDAHTVAVGATTYTAPSIIVATGSVPKRLPLDQCSGRVLDSADLLQLDRLPASLCIVGAGVIGMEFASIFSAFGTQVTVVEYLKECLPALDSDIAKRLRKALEKRGVTFHMQAAVKAIDHGTVTFDRKGRQETVTADEVLMAVGRAPRVADHFRNAGFVYDARQGIQVDENYETTVKGIYAIGDVNGKCMLAHAAEMQAKQVISHITTQHPTVATPIPAAIFTSPEAACVGPTEEQLKQRGQPYTCRKAFWRANGKALAMNETEGMLKLFADADDTIIGCHAYGAHSPDIVQEVTALMCRNTTVAQLADIVHIHPTLSEILKNAAEG